MKSGIVRKVVPATLVLNRPFISAVNQGLLKRNPIAGVRSLRDITIEKGVFTPEQIRALLDVANGDWKGLILAAYFTGARQTRAILRNNLISVWLVPF